MSFKGIDVRQAGDRIVFRASLKDSAGAKVTTGSATLSLFELQSDGSLKGYDFASNTFKTTALTTPTHALTHRTVDNGTTATGIWTYAHTTVTGFTRGNVYIAAVAHASASPPQQEREFQYGEGEGDLAVDDAGRVTVGNASATISLTGPVNVGNGSQLNLVQGDDYTTGATRIPTWVLSGYTGPSLSGATGKLRIMNWADYGKVGVAAVAALIVDATISQVSTTVTVTAPLTAAQTAALFATPDSNAKTHQYQIVATTPGALPFTLQLGAARVARFIPPAA